MRTGAEIYALHKLLDQLKVNGPPDTATPAPESVDEYPKFPAGIVYNGVVIPIVSFDPEEEIITIQEE